MEKILLVVHLIIAMAMIGVILIQRSEGGGLGMGGGGSGGMGQFMSVRGTANMLTRATAILAACFITTSLALAILASNRAGPTQIVPEQVQEGEQPVDAEPPVVPQTD